MTSIKDIEDKLTQLDQEALADNAQFDTALKCISEPFTWQLTESIVRNPAWKRHVQHVFKDLVPRWTFALSSSSHRPLLKSTLCHKGNSEAVAFAMARVGLPILIERLSTPQDGASLDTLTMYASCLKYLSLDKDIFKLYAQYIQKTDVTFFCSNLCSIPGHLANAFGIQLDQATFNSQHKWYIDRNFYAKTSKRLAENVTSKSILFSQELVSKIIKQGYQDILITSIYPIARSSPDHWSSIFEPCFDQVTKSILYHIKHNNLSDNINKASKELSIILFSNNSTRQIRIQDFLIIALLRLSKCSWADDVLARLAISTAIHAQGLNNSQALLIQFSERVIETWSDPKFIEHGSSREHITTALLCLIAYLSEEEIQYTLIGQTSLFRSVSYYFETGDPTTAQLGAVIAEAVSEKINPDNPVCTGLFDDDVGLQRMKGLANIKDASLDDKDEVNVVSEVESDDQEDQEDQEEELDPDAIYCPDNDGEDDASGSDDEFQAYQMDEESDDEGLKKEETSKSKASNKKPVFVRDLIRYLKDNADPLKLEIGLNAAEQVIRQKTGAGTELSESAVELATYLIVFPETFEIDNFRTLQQNALIALIFAVPTTVAGCIIDQLYDRNTSNGQKQLILAAISLAVRELSGWYETTTAPVEEVLTDSRKRLENNTSLAVGKIVFMSKRMEIEKQQKQNVRKNLLSGLAGPVFFFPLLVGWWEGAQGRIKHWIGNNNVLSERFIMTLNIILHSSTNIPDKRKIVQEYFEFVSSMMYASRNSIGITKALLLGIDCIVNTCYKGQESLLFHDYYEELSKIKVWLEEIMENNPEPKLQQISIGILLKLSQIALNQTSG